MRFSALSYLTVIAAAAGGSAFLIPPELTSDVDVTNFAEIDLSLLDLGSLVLPDPRHQVVKAACKGCLQDGGDGALIFDLTVSPLDPTKFLINGAEITPFDVSILSIPTENPFPATLRLPLVGANEELEDLALEDLKSRTVSVEYNLVSAVWTSDVGELAKMVVDAHKVDGRWVEGGKAEVVRIVLLREEEGGKIEIVGVEVGDLAKGEMSIDMGMGMMKDSEKDSACMGMFCGLDGLVETVREWSKVAEEKVKGWGKKVGNKFGCGGHMKNDQEQAKQEEATQLNSGNSNVPSIPSTQDTETTTTPAPWRRPHHHHHHRPFHHGAYRIHDDEELTVFGIVYRVIGLVLVQFVITVCAGMLVSLMGMVIWHFAVLAFNMAYLKITGRERVSCRFGREREVDQEDEEEGKALLVHDEEDAPPKYDDSEAVKVVVVECDEKQ